MSDAEASLLKNRNPVSHDTDTDKIQYLGSKPNWNIYELRKYKYIPSTTTATSNTVQTPIDIDIVSTAFESAGIDFNKYRNGILYLINLDLTIMNSRLIFEKVFQNEVECNYAINEYKKFIILYIFLQSKNNNNAVIIPSKLVDKIWHWHLLFLERYLKDCMKICGHIIYHSPQYELYDNNDIIDIQLLQTSRFNQMLIAYKTVFGYSSSETISICSKCGCSPFISDYTLNNLSFKCDLDIDTISNAFKASGIAFNKLREGVLYLINLDLSKMIPRMIFEKDFKDETECKLAINEYKKYLIIYMFLRGKSSNGMYKDLVPSVPVDLVWHCHILDLQKYIADCHKICGEIVIHNPRFDLQIKEFPDVQTPKYSKVFKSYPIIFGHKPPFKMWGFNPSIAAMCCDGYPGDDDDDDDDDNGGSNTNEQIKKTYSTKDWSTGLFDCFGDCGACLYVYFCPGCAAGEIYEKGELGSCCVGCLLFYFIGILYPCIFTGPLRAKKGIGIGDWIDDILLCCCCLCCQMTRELREVRGT